jgi:hypothetical protein
MLKGSNQTDGKPFITSNLTLTLEGYKHVTGYYFDLHSYTELVPQLLLLYKHKQAKTFGVLYPKAVSQVWGADQTLDFTDAKTIVALRQVFDEFGHMMYDEKAKSKHHVGTLLQLYARLPTYKLGKKGHCFYPAAALPSKAVLKGYFDRWGDGWSVS